MDRLYTPWRFSYLTAGERPACFLCDAAEHPDKDQESLVVHRAEHSFVILNRFPYTNGHVMIVPYLHVPSLVETPPEALTEIMLLAQRTEQILRDTYRCDGLNAGLNLGSAAGAGVAAHLHLHMLPRWIGDANFMTTVGETRVMPELLTTTWERLSAAFRA